MANDFTDDDFDYPRDFAGHADDDLAKAIGRLAITWSRLEFVTYLLGVCLLQGKAQNSFILFGSLGNRTVIDFLNTFADAKLEKAEGFGDDLRTLATELNRLLALRNRIVHGNWDTESKVPTNIVMRFKGKVRDFDETWSLDAINTVSEETAELHCAIMDFATRYHLWSYWQRHLRETEQEESDPPRPAEILCRNPNMTKLVRRALS
jgi:hypothetical protein